jgi:hypothetical protein
MCHDAIPAADAPDLAEAERLARQKQYASWVLMAEYDRRGIAEEARTAELGSVRAKLDRVLAANDEYHAELARVRAAVTALADEAKVVLVAGPDDCNDDCMVGPCSCSGTRSAAAWNLDPARLRETLGENRP